MFTVLLFKFAVSLQKGATFNQIITYFECKIFEFNLKWALVVRRRRL